MLPSPASRMRLLLAPVLLILALLAGDAASQEPLRVLLSPRGDDANDGLSLDTPILTLARAQELIAAILPEGGRDVELRIAAGTYRDQHVIWTFTMPEHSIQFMPLFNDGERPVFDGGVSGETWFILRHAKGEATNLVFRDIHVRNYWMGISFESNRSRLQTANSFNQIRGCVFERIGNIAVPERPPSYAAVRFINSDDNLVENCQFLDILNTRDCKLLHAIYLAHHSQRNRILRNHFENNCGDPIRLRDFSNDNEIRENRIVRSGMTGAYSEWYCDHDRLDNCTKREPECPSWNNVFSDNILERGFDGEELPVTKFFYGDSTTGCSPPSPSARRVILSGNRQL